MDEEYMQQTKLSQRIIFIVLSLSCNINSERDANISESKEV